MKDNLITGNVEFDIHWFSDKTPHITNVKMPVDDNIRIVYRGMGDQIMELACLVDAIRQIQTETGNYKYINLIIPFFPGARQDRYVNKGESLTVKVYANFINMMGFDTVAVADSHSDVSTALLNNCIILKQHEIFSPHLPKGSILVSPDAGAIKKVQDLAFAIGSETIIKCDKHRDKTTGRIDGFTVHADNLDRIKDASLYVVDDICDGGGTFLGIADTLKSFGAKELHLCVTHGLFSKGTSIIKEKYDSIISTDSLRTGFLADETIEIVGP
jgi:ribose-phosphate pyrophosphokinase